MFKGGIFSVVLLPSVYVLAAASLSLAAADYQYIISVPEGDLDPRVKSYSSGADIDTLCQTVEFSDGIDLVTTPFKGFYIHFR
jgi:hypothetical protein